MAITKYEGRTFTNQVFQLEECWFINCVLRECTIFYGGGSYDLQNATFDNCHWRFQGAANQTFQLLTQIGLLRAGQTPPMQVKATGGGPVN